MGKKSYRAMLVRACHVKNEERLRKHAKGKPTPKKSTSKIDNFFTVLQKQTGSVIAIKPGKRVSSFIRSV